MDTLVTNIETSITEQAGIVVEVLGVTVETVAVAATPTPTPAARKWPRVGAPPPSRTLGGWGFVLVYVFSNSELERFFSNF